ncbi:MAG: hypothetical protein LKG27_04315 [Clostridiaceae bacterium]|jgi:hypothetical protein|nr:hypothetical protein [Clostridiaceae bacterium]
MAGNIPMTAGLGGFGLYPTTNSYSNAVAMSDMFDSAMGTQSSLNNPMANMNSSIFNGSSNLGTPNYLSSLSTLGTATPTTAATDATSGYGYGYNPDAYYKYMDKNQDFMINYSIKQQERMRNADMRVNSPYEAAALNGKLLHEKIMEDEQQQVLGSFAKYCEQVQSMYGGRNKEEVLARAEQMYQAQYGTTIEDDLKTHGKSSFTQGALQSLSFGLADNRTAAENVSAITGEPIGRADRAEKIAGNILGAAAIGSVTTVGLKVLSKAFNWKMLKNKPLIGMIVGLGAGIIAVMKNQDAL